MYKNNVILLSKVQKNTKSINLVNLKTNNGRTMILLQCAICVAKKQEKKGLLSNLGIRTPLSKLTLLGDVLF